MARSEAIGDMAGVNGALMRRTAREKAPHSWIIRLAVLALGGRLVARPSQVDESPPVLDYPQPAHE